MVSTGGTLVPTLEELSARGVRIEGVLFVGEKPQHGGRRAVEDAGFRIKNPFELTPTRQRIKVQASNELIDAVGPAEHD